ncbi:MAG: FtsX-like permease family protein [Chloroflexi bacterium]|nr:FtsX-like permease family protein [Chloroflexota bacterium]
MQLNIKDIWNDLRVSLFLVYKAITRGNKFTLILTILVTTLAFINIIFISSIMNGAISKAYQQAKENYVSNIVVLPGIDEKYISQVSQLKTQINTLPGVISCCSRYAAQGVLRYDPDKDGNDVKEKAWNIKSINPEEEVKVTNLQNYIVEGRYLEETDRDQILLGREISGGYGASFELSSLKGARAGEEITVIYGNGVKRTYTIKGIYNTMFPLADLNVYVTEKEMESVLQLHNRASEILVKTDASVPEKVYIERLRQMGIENEQINIWFEFIGYISGLTQTFDTIKGIITFIGLLVAGITIFIVIFIATVNRRRQIGILKAIGMKERIIIMSYIFQAVFYALFGVTAGLLIVNFLLVPYFMRHPFPMPIGLVSLALVNRDLAVSVFSMILVSIVAGFIPSWMVTRQNIIKAIWG